jgi:hypothetical protein
MAKSPYNGCKMARILGFFQQGALEVSLKDDNDDK